VGKGERRYGIEFRELESNTWTDWMRLGLYFGTKTEAQITATELRRKRYGKKDVIEARPYRVETLTKEVLVGE